MARNPTRARAFSTGGSNSKSFYLNRDGSQITVINASNASREDLQFKTVAEAKAIMNNPGKICK